MFQMMGVFAEFERAMIRDRVRSGMAKAKAHGKTFGRPTISQAKRELIVSRLREGACGMMKIGRDLGVGTGTVQRIKTMMAVLEAKNRFVR